MNITALAPELILFLTSYLSIQDRKSLRLSCKQLSQFVATDLLRSIVVDVKRQHHDLAADQIRRIAKQQAPVEVVQRLIINSLSPQYNPDHRRTTQKNPRYGSYQSATPKISEADIGVTEEVIYRFLRDALSSLRNVHDVVWTPQATDTILAHQILASTLPTLPHLRHLEVNVTHCKVPLDFASFRNLESIKYKGISQAFYEENMKSITHALYGLPHLTSLDMECATHPTKPALEVQNVHALFGESDHDITDVKRPQLCHLGLRFYLIRIDLTTLPYFKSLTSLELRNTNDPRLISSSYPDLHGPLPYNSRFDDIWRAFQHHQIHLQKVSVDSVVPAFLDYLHSYSGLRSLILAPRTASTDVEVELATRFFQETLPVHKETLRDLAIKAVEEGPWCYHKQNLLAISHCRNLVSLHMAVESSQMMGMEYSPQAAHLIDLLVTCAVENLPKLSEIYIKGAILNELRGGRRIAAVEHHLALAEDALVRYLARCTLPPTSNPVPMICVCINQGHDKSTSVKERWFGKDFGTNTALRFVEL